MEIGTLVTGVTGQGMRLGKLIGRSAGNAPRCHGETCGKSMVSCRVSSWSYTNPLMVWWGLTCHDSDEEIERMLQYFFQHIGKVVQRIQKIQWSLHSWRNFLEFKSLQDAERPNYLDLVTSRRNLVQIAWSRSHTSQQVQQVQQVQRVQQVQHHPRQALDLEPRTDATRTSWDLDAEQLQEMAAEKWSPK